MDEGRRILVVDDDFACRELALAILRRLLRDVQVDGADSGPAALQALSVRQYDVVVTDLMMPHMTGEDLIAEASARWPSLSFVIMTARDPSDEDGLPAGVPIVHKPFTTARLRQAVQGMLDGPVPERMAV